jgi:hypothetical protein
VLPLSLGDVAQHSAIVSIGIVCRVGEAACMQALGMSCDDASVLLGNNAYLLVLLITFPLALLQGARLRSGHFPAGCGVHRHGFNQSHRMFRLFRTRC